MPDLTIALTVGPWGGVKLYCRSGCLKLTLGFVAVTMGCGEPFLMTFDEQVNVLRALESTHS